MYNKGEEYELDKDEQKIIGRFFQSVNKSPVEDHEDEGEKDEDEGEGGEGKKTKAKRK